MLLPKLGRKPLAKIRESLETGVSLHGGIKQRREVVNPLERPASTHKIAFEVALYSFLQEFHRAVTNTARVANGIGSLQPFPAKQEPVTRVGFVRPQARRSPERTTSA